MVRTTAARVATLLPAAGPVGEKRAWRLGRIADLLGHHSNIVGPL